MSGLTLNKISILNYKNIFHIPEGVLGKNQDGWLFLGYPIESYIDK